MSASAETFILPAAVDAIFFRQSHDLSKPIKMKKFMI
jgi:hypothetical protein